jgi:O-antigen ligase
MSSFFLFSKESLFAFYLVSGVFKLIYPLLYISAIPDITALSAILLVIIMFRETPELLTELSIDRVEIVTLLTLFYFFIIISLGYTTSQSYCITKTVNFGTVVLALFFPLLTKKFNIDYFIYSFTLFTFFISIVFLNFYITYLNQDIILHMSSEDARELTVGYLAVAEFNGILVLYYFFSRREIPIVKWSLVLIAFILLFASGGRGPLIFTLLILGGYLLYQLLLFLVSFKIKKLVLPLLILTIFAISIIFAILTKNIESKDSKSLKLIENSIERLSTLKNSEGGGDSAYSRVLYTRFAIDKINQRPILGYGIGSFGFEYNNIDESDYHHNIFLEVWFELGIIPIILFLLLFYIVYQRIILNQSAWAMALYFYFLLNILKSSSLIDIRIVTGFFAIFILIKSSEIFKLKIERKI